jgi:hypothetical protein
MMLAGVVVFHAVASWPSQITDYSNPYVWRIMRFPYQAALRLSPEDSYLKQNFAEYPILRMLEEKVPKGERVFTPTGFATSYTSREIIQAFQGGFNNDLNDFLFLGWLQDYQPTRLLVFSFPEHPIRRIRLLLTAHGEGYEQWNVHELRFFDRQAEVPRNGSWRLRAWPNPWDVQLAFDNSEATRWRSWETGAPGMYLDVDFGSQQNIDEVHMETSRDWAWPFRFEVQSQDGQGGWTTLVDKFTERSMQIHGSTRRAAAYELRARGIHYVLIWDTDWGADDFKDDPEAWGFEIVAMTPRATLYRIVW